MPHRGGVVVPSTAAPGRPAAVTPKIATRTSVGSVRGTGSPVRGVGSPVRGVGSPLRGTASPLRGLRNVSSLSTVRTSSPLVLRSARGAQAAATLPSVKSASFRYQGEEVTDLEKKAPTESPPATSRTVSPFVRQGGLGPALRRAPLAQERTAISPVPLSLIANLQPDVVTAPRTPTLDSMERHREAVESVSPIRPAPCPVFFSATPSTAAPELLARLRDSSPVPFAAVASTSLLYVSQPMSLQQAQPATPSSAEALASASEDAAAAVAAALAGTSGTSSASRSVSRHARRSVSPRSLLTEDTVKGMIQAMLLVDRAELLKLVQAERRQMCGDLEKLVREEAEAFQIARRAYKLEAVTLREELGALSSRVSSEIIRLDGELNHRNDTISAELQVKVDTLGATLAEATLVVEDAFTERRRAAVETKATEAKIGDVANRLAKFEAIVAERVATEAKTHAQANISVTELTARFDALHSVIVNLREENEQVTLSLQRLVGQHSASEQRITLVEAQGGELRVSKGELDAVRGSMQQLARDVLKQGGQPASLPLDDSYSSRLGGVEQEIAALRDTYDQQLREVQSDIGREADGLRRRLEEIGWRLDKPLVAASGGADSAGGGDGAPLPVSQHSKVKLDQSRPQHEGKPSSGTPTCVSDKAGCTIS